MSQLNFFSLATTEENKNLHKGWNKNTVQNNQSLISANGIAVHWVSVLIFILLLRCT